MPASTSVFLTHESDLHAPLIDAVKKSKKSNSAGMPNSTISLLDSAVKELLRQLARRGLSSA